jgi:hypothetical protein
MTKYASSIAAPQIATGLHIQAENHDQAKKKPATTLGTLQPNIANLPELVKRPQENQGPQSLQGFPHPRWRRFGLHQVKETT